MRSRCCLLLCGELRVKFTILMLGLMKALQRRFFWQLGSEHSPVEAIPPLLRCQRRLIVPKLGSVRLQCHGHLSATSPSFAGTAEHISSAVLPQL